MQNTIIRFDPVLRLTFDRTAAAVGLILLSPLFAAIALAVKLYDGGPIFYRALRVGKAGRLFELYKFRTMVVQADRMGPAITASADSRITPIGRFLRRAKLDELPQLLNVLIGDMSLVGPRPEAPCYVALYTPEQRRILDVAPGITSAASVRYRHEELMLAGPNWEQIYRDEVMPAKLVIDLDYLARRTLLSDMLLIAKTIVAVFE